MTGSTAISIFLAASLFLACSTPAWKADETLARQYMAAARAAESEGDFERMEAHVGRAVMHFKQAQRIYLIEIQADRNMRAGVAAAAVQAYGVQHLGAEADEDGQTVCVPAGSTLVCR